MKRRKYWVNDLYARRGEDSEYVKLFDELRLQPPKFFEYFRMSSSTFDYILNRITPRIQKYSNFRECIGPREKLTITLRYSTYRFINQISYRVKSLLKCMKISSNV